MRHNETNIRFYFYNFYDILIMLYKERSDNMSKRKSKNSDADELPKAVRAMKNTKKDEQVQPNKSKKRKSKNKRKNYKKILLIIVIIIILMIGITFGISAHRWKTLANDMVKNESSIVIDKEGNTIAKLGDEKKRENLSAAEMPKKLKEAYVAIEDERFYKHHGVDIKRTASAIFSYIIHFGSSSFGGSTITQQLVKNITGDSTDSVVRKVNEWWKAWLLETQLSKDEILTSYLNIIYIGPSIYGVENGAKYYFNKSAGELSLSECAFLAGLNHSPNSYNPFGNKDNSDKIKSRTKTVLGKMKELEYINENEYTKAVQEVEKGLKFKNGDIKAKSDGVYSYHTDALITEITTDIADKYNISETFATNYINMAGLTIHSTQDSKIQKETEKESSKKKYILKSQNGKDTSQAAMVIMDHKTGQVLACTGGLGEKTEVRPFNRATQSVRQTGSAIKPLAVLVPGIDKKLFTASTIYNDTEKDFEDNYHPVDYISSLGNITVRRSVESSQNIPFVDMMEEIKPSVSIKYMKKMGITTLTEKDKNLPLALGGLEKGISPLQMAGAYSAIANDGKYIEPTFYTAINRASGTKVIETRQKKKKAFSKEVAYIVKELLTEPVKGANGTATYCKINGVDVAAKTGTTDENYDRWLCGFTPYYTAVTWFGYDQNETVNFNQRNPAGLIWANVMSKIHSGLKTAKFEKPSGVIGVTICAETGMKATTGCPHTYTEYFLWFTTPQLCNKHSGQEMKTNIDNDSKNNTETEIIKGITNEIDAKEPDRTTAPTNSTQTNTNSNTITNNTTNNNKNQTNTQLNINKPSNNNTSINNSTNNSSNTNTSNNKNESTNTNSATNATNKNNTTNTTNNTIN